MKALTWNGSYDVRVENVPDPVLIDDTDILLGKGSAPPATTSSVAPTGAAAASSKR